MLMSACFASSLISHLTTPTYSEKMDTLKELVEQEYFWTTNTMLDFRGIFNLEVCIVNLAEVRAIWTKLKIINVLRENV